MRLLAIDPGIRGCGAALFIDRVLVKAAYVKNSVPKGDDPKAILGMALQLHYWVDPVILIYGYNQCYMSFITECVLEWPQVYRAGKLKGDPNDLLPLAGIGCALGAYLQLHDATVRYLPREWKGQLPKDVVRARVIERLSPDERDAITETRKSLLHNVYDAVGIGLFHLGRFTPKRLTTEIGLLHSDRLAD